MYYNTEGCQNTALGKAMTKNCCGANNVGLGYLALDCNADGSNNTAVGSQALNFTTTSNNTAMGYGAAYCVTGCQNTAVGSLALRGNATVTGNCNTAVGMNAMRCISAGVCRSVAIGNGALYVHCGNNTVAIGTCAGASTLGS